MAKSRTCGKCIFFIKVNWHDGPKEHLHCFGRNGLCEKYDYNVRSDGTYAAKCKGFKKINYKRSNNHNPSLYPTAEGLG